MDLAVYELKRGSHYQLGRVPLQTYVIVLFKSTIYPHPF